MRLIGTVLNESYAKRLSAYFDRQKISHRCEAVLDPSRGSVSYQLWVTDEDQLDQAHAMMVRFQENPGDPLYNIPIEQLGSEEKKDEPPRPPVMRSLCLATWLFLILCIGVYGINWVQAKVLEKTLSQEAPRITPVEEKLFFDLPRAVEEIDALARKTADSAEAQREFQTKAEAWLSMPRWEGVYSWLVLEIKTGNGSAAVGPMFVKIGQGEVWRLFSPCILHRDFLHILFNLIWLWALGRPIEERIGFWRTLALALTAGVFSNCIQYLASGFYFMGYSGVIMAFAGFIWMREKIAPWEGYPIHKSTLRFLAIFVFGMLALQLAAFAVQIASNAEFSVPIANAAHISGLILGAVLGRMAFFKRSVR